MAGLSDWASYTESGEKEEKPKYPFCLVIKPNPELRDRIQAKSAAEGPFPGLEELKTGEEPYSIYAATSPDPSSLVLIGKVVLTSPFVGSKFADERLSFKHTPYADDVALGGEQWAAWDKEMTMERLCV